MDITVVGSDVAGLVLAHELARSGHKVQLYERRSQLGGALSTQKMAGIQVHTQGPQVFRTSRKSVWEFINRFAYFNDLPDQFTANVAGTTYDLTFNMETFDKLWGTKTPGDAQKIMEEQKQQVDFSKTHGLEKWALAAFGVDLYEKFIRHYAEKMWGRPCSELSVNLASQLPVRFSTIPYFRHEFYQGIPLGGYQPIIEKLLLQPNIILHRGVDYLAHKRTLETQSDVVLYTEALDRFFNYRFGRLPYRSLRYEFEVLDQPHYQTQRDVYYTGDETPYTRITEYKNFEYYNGLQQTVIAKEYAYECQTEMDDPRIPVFTTGDYRLVERYRNLAEQEEKTIFCGGLANFKTFDVALEVEEALSVVRYLRR